MTERVIATHGTVSAFDQICGKYRIDLSSEERDTRPLQGFGCSNGGMHRRAGAVASYPRLPGPGRCRHHGSQTGGAFAWRGRIQVMAPPRTASVRARNPGSWRRIGAPAPTPPGLRRLPAPRRPNRGHPRTHLGSTAVRRPVRSRFRKWARFDRHRVTSEPSFARASPRSRGSRAPLRTRARRRRSAPGEFLR